MSADGVKLHYPQYISIASEANFLVPHFTEEHIIIEMREHRGKFSQLVSSCVLYDLFSHLSLPYFPIVWSPVDQTCFSFAASGLFCAMTPASGWGT